MEPTRSARPSAASPTRSSAACASVSRRTACCIIGQGKWYPGESLPRWAFGLYWRKDGVPIWRDAALIAREHGRSERPRDRRTPDERWLRWPRGSAARLRLRAAGLRGPGSTGSSRRRSCPTTWTPLDPKIDDPEARARMRPGFGRGLPKPAGYVLPLQRWTQGEAPAGIRNAGRPPRQAVPGAGRFAAGLPPAARPAAAPAGGALPHVLDEGPVGGARELRCPASRGVAAKRRAPKPSDIARWRATALAVEPRDGAAVRVHAAAGALEDYLDLLAAIEAAPRRRACPCRSRATRRPSTRASSVIKVTPDPGVIEVNVQPAASWREAVDTTRRCTTRRARCGSAPTSS